MEAFGRAACTASCPLLRLSLFVLAVVFPSAVSAPVWTSVGPHPAINVVPLIADHATVILNGTLFTYGGLVHAFSDSLTYEAVRIPKLFAFDIATGTTREVATTGDAPLPRAYHTMNLAKGSDTAYAYGGKCVASTFCDDMWSLNLALQGGGALGGATPIWRKIVFAGSSRRPAARYAHAAVAADDRRVWVSGGSTSVGIQADLWVFDPQTSEWAEFLPSAGTSVPPGRTGHVLFSRQGGMEMCVHGGKGVDKQYRDDIWCVDVSNSKNHGEWRELGRG